MRVCFVFVCVLCVRFCFVCFVSFVYEFFEIDTVAKICVWNRYENVSFIRVSANPNIFFLLIYF